MRGWHYMDEHMAKFEERLKELVKLGKKKKGILEIQEINDFFHDIASYFRILLLYTKTSRLPLNNIFCKRLVITP